MSASIEASLRLEIAQYQAALAKAKGDAVKFKEDLKRNSADMGAAMLGKPESWHSHRASMAAFRSQMGQEGEASGGLMGLGLQRGLMRFAGPAALTAIVGAGLKNAVSAAMDDEVMNVRMNVIVGDDSKAQQLIGSLKALGARTPLEFKDLAEAGSLLVAFGEDAANVPAVLTRIGDVAQGVGAPLREIAEIYGKARVQNQLFAEDINQLTGRGIPVIQEFARILGRSESEIKKLASEGKITFPLLEAAFKKLTGDGGKFAGMMDEMSRTGMGKWSTFKDEVSQTSALFGRPLSRAWGSTLDWLTEKAGGLKKVLRSMNETAPEGIARLQAEEAAKNQKPEDNAAKEAKLRADFEAAENAKKEAAQRKLAAKEQEERDKQLKDLVGMRQEAERLSIAMLPDDQRLAAMREQLKDLLFDASFKALGSGQHLDTSKGVDGLGELAAAHAKSGNRTAEMSVLKQYKEALAIQQQIDDLQSKADSENKKTADDQRRLKDTRAVLDLEVKIAKEQARTGKDDGAEVQKFRDQLNVIQLTAQLQDQLKLSQAEALKIAVQKVSAERAAAEAIKAQAEAEKKKSQLYNRQELAAQLRAEALRAEGKNKEADALERRIRVVNEAKRIESATGLDPARAMQIAERREKMRAHDERSGDDWTGGDRPRRRINAHIDGGANEARNRARQRIIDSEQRRQESIAKQGPRGLNEFWALQRGEIGDLGRKTGMSAMGGQYFGGQHAQNAQRQSSAPATVNLSAREMEVLMQIKEGILNLLN